jgi:hypothetical protein
MEEENYIKQQKGPMEIDMTNEFKVYHVPGEKIGCTNDWPQRVIDQGFNPDACEFLFTSNDGWEAGDKERELQKEYGYKVDRQHYMVSRENRRKGGIKGGLTNKESGHWKEVCIIGGKTVGPENGQKLVESGKWKEIVALGTIAAAEKITCKVCGTSSSTGNHSKWHGKNCMWPDVQLLLSNLPDEFTWKQSKEISTRLFGNHKLATKVVMGNYENLIEKVYQGLPGSNLDVSRYRVIKSI